MATKIHYFEEEIVASVEALSGGDLRQSFRPRLSSIARKIPPVVILRHVQTSKITPAVARKLNDATLAWLHISRQFRQRTR